MSYEAVRSAYRLWTSDDPVETYLALGLVAVALAPVALRWWRESSRGAGENPEAIQ